MRKQTEETIQEHVRKTYQAIAGEFNETRKEPWAEFQHFLEFVKSGTRVLDLGCGNGRLYGLFKDKKVDYLGVDNNSVLLEKARTNFPEARFQMGDMTCLHLPDNYFDAIFSIASFHHIPGRRLRRQTADEIFRLLKPNGVLILTVWNLFQWKYLKNLAKAFFSFILHLGLKYAWNDVWIEWGHCPMKRYYHAFLPHELLHYFNIRHWKIEEFYFVRKGCQVKFWRSFNLCLIARKQIL